MCDIHVTAELIPKRTNCQMKCREGNREAGSLDNPPYRIHNWISPAENTAPIDWKTMSLTAGEHKRSHGC